jgi:type VI secretion system secreted protein Hcp
MKRILFLILLAAGLTTQSLHAAYVDYFLRLEGIDGESTDDRHKNTIEVQSFHWGIAQTGGTASGGGGGGAGKVIFQDMHFVAKVSKASPKLMLACASGQHIPLLEFFVHRAGGDTQDYLKITLKDVYITSYQTGGSSAAGDVVPTDQISVNFTEIKFDHTSTNGTVTSGMAIRPLTVE